MIKNYPNFKMFKDLVYPFIKLDTLCSENIPIDILNAIFLYIQQYCLKIKNFICAKNKVKWHEYSWNWDIDKLRKYLIDKYIYKYKWLENAETKENYDQTILKFFNKNKPSQSIDIRLRLEGDKIYGYLKGRKTEKIGIPIPKIETFLIKFHRLSKEESIGRSFSNLYTSDSSKFMFLLLSAFTSFTFNTSVIFSKDVNFIRCLEAAKEDFDNVYLAIKNPNEYSFESLFMEDLWELAHKKSKDEK